MLDSLKTDGTSANTASITLRRAVPADAPVLADVFRLASDGLVDYFWEAAREPGEALADVAERRMKDKIADPSNDIWIAEFGGEPAGGIVSYDVGDKPEPLEGLTPLVASLVAFENDALETRYVNAIAVFAPFRRKGIARHLLSAARRDGGGRQMSLGVSDVNPGAQALYEAAGFRATGTYPMVKDGWDGPGENWILMKTDLTP